MSGKITKIRQINATRETIVGVKKLLSAKLILLPSQLIRENLK